MKFSPSLLLASLAFPFLWVNAADLSLTTPLDFQVIQRTSRDTGTILLSGTVPDKTTSIEARLVIAGQEGEWKKLTPTITGPAFKAPMEAPAGGWHRLDVRALSGAEVLGQTTVEHLGIGEVFVVAGQSNSANHGETKLTTTSERVATFTGTKWQIANDPQPGASGGGGSFLPPFGDAVVKWFDVPVGFIACGIGATSVREWLPKGSTFPNPPTIENRVQKRADGSWESKGEAYANFVDRLKPLGPQGFRAVLWHQGESDANQKDQSRTLPGPLYRDYLKQIITQSRKDIGWDAPWFVAQVSYHVPGDEASPDIREAQASLWKDGVALEGPDSDALKGDLRERNGQGVHFSEKGLKTHAAKWAEKVCPWIEQTLIGTPITQTDVRYGTHPKQVLHFWQAKSDQPTPLIFYMHGGGWMGGDRMKRLSQWALKALAAGISVVSIEYRFIPEATADGESPPVRGPMMDAARALQFVRAKATEWNIDKKRIGMCGGSAGGCTTLWLAFHDDLADPQSKDPIARESTRLFCAATWSPQTTLDPLQMKEWTPNSRYGAHAFGVKATKPGEPTFDAFLAARDSLLTQINEYSPYAHVTSDDPPVYLFHETPPALGKNEEDPTHSANFGLKLQEKCQSVSVPCELVYPGAPNTTHAEVVDFLIATLKEETK